MPYTPPVHSRRKCVVSWLFGLPMKTGVMPLMQVFVSISDPRSPRHTQHDLAELLTVVVCGVLSGADDFVGIEEWAKLKLDWLRGFMKLEQGIPSHDTLARVFGLISPDEFEAAFRRWVGMVIPALAKDTWWPSTARPAAARTTRRTPTPIRCTW
jgi:AraC-like DNA-binding protein